MNTSKAVDAYIAKAPEYARPICEKLRAIIRKAAPELTETIKWGGPWYVGRGLVCGFGAFKQHVRLHFYQGGQLPDPDRILTDGEDNASGMAMKISEVKDIPAKPLERLVREAAKRDASATKISEPRAKRPELPMPDDLAKAIRQSAKATAYWAEMPPSCRREYIEWIISAKREETRARRLDQALTMLCEGRRKHEEYRK